MDVEHAMFEDSWKPFTFGVALLGPHVAGLEPDPRTASCVLRRERLLWFTVLSLGEGLGGVARRLDA